MTACEPKSLRAGGSTCQRAWLKKIQKETLRSCPDTGVDAAEAAHALALRNEPIVCPPEAKADYFTHMLKDDLVAVARTQGDIDDPANLTVDALRHRIRLDTLRAYFATDKAARSSGGGGRRSRPTTPASSSRASGGRRSRPSTPAASNRASGGRGSRPSTPSATKKVTFALPGGQEAAADGAACVRKSVHDPQASRCQNEWRQAVHDESAKGCPGKSKSASDAARALKGTFQCSAATLSTAPTTTSAPSTPSRRRADEPAPTLRKATAECDKLESALAAAMRAHEEAMRQVQAAAERLEAAKRAAAECADAELRAAKRAAEEAAAMRADIEQRVAAAQTKVAQDDAAAREAERRAANAAQALEAARRALKDLEEAAQEAGAEREAVRQQVAAGEQRVKQAVLAAQGAVAQEREARLRAAEAQRALEAARAPIVFQAPSECPPCPTAAPTRAQTVRSLPPPPPPLTSATATAPRTAPASAPRPVAATVSDAADAPPLGALPPPPAARKLPPPPLPISARDFPPPPPPVRARRGVVLPPREADTNAHYIGVRAACAQLQKLEGASADGRTLSEREASALQEGRDFLTAMAKKYNVDMTKLETKPRPTDTKRTGWWDWLTGAQTGAQVVDTMVLVMEANCSLLRKAIRGKLTPRMPVSP